MYVSINMQEMKVMHKHPSINVVSNLVYLEAPKSACHISTLEMCLKDKTDLEVKMLYRNTLGVEKVPEDAKRLLLSYIAATFPVTDVIPEELARLAATVGVNDKKAYKYIKGQFSSFFTTPILDKPIETPRYHPDPLPGYFPKKHTALDDLNDNDPLPVKDEPVIRQPREPRDPSQPSARPKAGSATGKVWDIADEISQTVTDEKQLRKSVIERCVNEGINSSTASVQFGRWKNSR